MAFNAIVFRRRMLSVQYYVFFWIRFLREILNRFCNFSKNLCTDFLDSPQTPNWQRNLTSRLQDPSILVKERKWLFFYFVLYSIIGFWLKFRPNKLIPKLIAKMIEFLLSSAKSYSIPWFSTYARILFSLRFNMRASLTREMKSAIRNIPIMEANPTAIRPNNVVGILSPNPTVVIVMTNIHNVSCKNVYEFWIDAFTLRMEKVEEI